MGLSADQYQTAADQAVANGIDPALVYNTIAAESSGNQYGRNGQILTSSTGAQGLGQLEPRTAASLGVDATDPNDNIRGTATYLGQLSRRYGGDARMASLAYNAGPGNVDRGNVGPGSVAYAHKVTGNLPNSEDEDPAYAAAIQSVSPRQGATPQDEDPAYADAIKSVQPSAAQDAGPRAVDLYSGAPLTAAQTATVKAMGSLYDPTAPQGSRAFPHHADSDADIADVPVGHYYIPPGGGLLQKGGTAGAGKPDFGVGLTTGLSKPFDNVALAVDTGLRSIGVPTDQISHALGMPTTRETIAAHEAALQQQQAQGHTPGFWGKLLGETATTLPMLAAGGELAGGAAGAVDGLAGMSKAVPLVTKLSSGLSGSVLGGAAGGAMTTDTRDPLGVVADMAKGAAGGAVTHGLINTAGGIIGPKISSAAQMMRDAGVSLTPGGYLAGSGTVGDGIKATEDKLTSLPFGFVGDAIKSAKTASLNSFNRGAANQSLAPIGKTLPADVAVGHDAIAHIGQAIGDYYEPILKNVTLAGDQPLASEFANIRANQLGSLPQAHQDQFTRIIRDNIVPKIGPSGVMDGQSFKLADGNIGRLAAAYSSDPDTNNRLLGHALSDAQGSLRDALSRQNPAYAPQLDAANASWAMFSRLRQAASALGSTDGVFTPGTLKGAIRAGDSSVGKGAFARGDALMQPFAEAAQKTVPSAYPDSGTAGRMLLNTGATGIPMVMAGHIATPAVGAAAAMDGLYGTQTGRKIMQTMFDRPDWARNLGATLQGPSRYQGMFGAMSPILIDQRDRPTK